MKSGSDDRYYILGLLVLVCTLNYVDRVAIGVFGEAIKNELRLSDGQLGLLAGAAFIIFYAVLGLPMGHLADRFGRKWLMSGCLALWSLMTAAAGFAHGFNQLMLARILVGVGESGCTPTAHSWLSDAFPASKRAMALSMYATGVPIGIIVGTIGGGWVAGQLGWRAGLFAVGLPGVALAARRGRRPPAGGLQNDDDDAGRQSSVLERDDRGRVFGGRPVQSLDIHCAPVDPRVQSSAL
jgi:MFS family permease